MRIEDFETPAIQTDLANVETNILCVQRQFDAFGMGFRLHIKFQRFPFLARLQLHAGAINIAR
ncbi:MAG: hypothetical protein ACOH2H_05790 [Cypionkella sp.]